VIKAAAAMPGYLVVLVWIKRGIIEVDLLTNLRNAGDDKSANKASSKFKLLYSSYNIMFSTYMCNVNCFILAQLNFSKFPLNNVSLRFSFS
jgi:hypothetical protein